VFKIDIRFGPGSLNELLVQIYFSLIMIKKYSNTNLNYYVLNINYL